VWLPNSALKGDAQLRLFCLPYAGAGPSVYFPWVREFRESPIEIRPVHLPGRESRFSEKPCESIDEVVGHAVPALEPLLDDPYCLFGHSLGGTIAFELVRELRRRNKPLPLELYVSSSQPPHISRDEPPLHELPREDFLREVALRYNGVPAELKQHPELLDIFLPILRADLKLLETFRYREEAALQIPLTALAGDSDNLMPQDLLERWREQTVQKFNARLFPGAHFYLKDSREKLLEFLKADLAKKIPQKKF
jgi:medium-chain acyl-[acyl-carrier-protein] hydrolase